MVETAEAEQISRAATSLLFPDIGLGIAANETCPSEDPLEVLARIAFDNEFANAGAEAYKLARGDDGDIGTESRDPLARALLYHLRGSDVAVVELVVDHAHTRCFAG
jgi:hypothetical protein